MNWHLLVAVIGFLVTLRGAIYFDNFLVYVSDKWLKEKLRNNFIITITRFAILLMAIFSKPN